MPTVLITGANRGLGLEFARQYAAEGWRVHACCRHPDKAKDLKAIEGEVVRHKLDVTDGLQVAGLSRELADEAIDLLINNAGVYEEHKTFQDADLDEWLEVLKVNTLAPFRMARRFADHVARGERKVIANVSSGLGSIARNDGGGIYPYRSSKAALNMVVKGLSVDLADRGIVVVAFAPGWVRTDMGGEGADLVPEESITALRKSMEALTPADSGRYMDRFGEDLPW